VSIHGSKRTEGASEEAAPGEAFPAVPGRDPADFFEGKTAWFMDTID
jgi:hypothetical protein